MSIKVKNIKPEFVDERGFISRIIDDENFSVRSILLIKRKKGSVGANHYHKKDKHYIYILKGKVKYLEKNVRDKKSEINSVILEEGDLVLSKPMMAHSTEFLEDTEILAFSISRRNQIDYESDTVRVDFFNK